MGRTGAGKSSLIAALLRLAKAQGSILIDNFDISVLSMEVLRKHISIIPQVSHNQCDFKNLSLFGFSFDYFARIHYYLLEL